MNYVWEITKEAQTHLDFWISSNNKSILLRIQKLISEIDKNLITGIGKPELLKRDLSVIGAEELILNIELYTVSLSL